MFMQNVSLELPSNSSEINLIETLPLKEIISKVTLYFA